jgi:type I restriction enzyme, S subunit
MNTKTKPGHKQVILLYKKLVEIPDDWEIDIGEKLFKLSGGIAPDNVNFSENGNCLFVQVDDMNSPENYKEIFTSKLKFHSEDNLSVNIRKIRQIVFPKRGAAILGNKVRILKENYTVDPNLMLLECKKKIDVEFFYYQILFLNVSNLMESAGVPQLNNKDLYPRNFLKPSFLEQQKIASILSNLDNFINLYNQIIQSTKTLQQSLLNKLLIQGIKHKNFKNVKNFFNENFEIPKEWDYPKFSQIVKVNPLTKIEGDKVPYIPMDAVNTEQSDVNYFEERDSQGNSGLPKFQENDVLFARITPSTENGKTCLIENFSGKGIASSELTVLRPSKQIIPRYLYYYVKSHRVREFAISQMMGSTGRQRVPDYVFKNDLHFELPSIPEQQKIVSILSSMELKIEKQMNYKTNLEYLKKGLMQKLLTGEIRVKV